MHIGFALEYSLGHTTHAQNLKQALTNGAGSVAGIQPAFVDLPYEGMRGAWTQLPLIRSNWSVRASLGAYLGLRPLARRLRGALFHTQVTSLFSAGFMGTVPSVVSLDATPIQYDAQGAFYGHQVSQNARLEALKKRMNQRAFAAAKRLVTWSQWAKDSLVTDYGVPAEKIIVIPPGIEVSRWNFARSEKKTSSPVHLLFVGGDFARKGGETLLTAFHNLPVDIKSRTHLHIVTKTPGLDTQNQKNISVYYGVAPNSETLMSLFAQADIFVFPTRGDCLPLAILEALASGLPIITTAIGAVPEAVTHGKTGWIVPPNDAPALAEAISQFVGDAALRREMGLTAKEVACERFDAEKNYAALLGVISEIAR